MQELEDLGTLKQPAIDTDRYYQLGAPNMQQGSFWWTRHPVLFLTDCHSDRVRNRLSHLTAIFCTVSARRARTTSENIVAVHRYMNPCGTFTPPERPDGCLQFVATKKTTPRHPRRASCGPLWTMNGGKRQCF